MGESLMKRILTGGHSRRQVIGLLGGAALASPALIRSARAATALKIGVILPKSGPLAQIGQACQRGCELGVAYLKERGIDVELMSADSETNADTGRTQAEKLVREGAHMLMGCFDSPTTSAVAQVAEQRGIPFLINIASDPKITEQGYKFVFRNFPTANMLMVSGLSRFKEVFAAAGTAPKTAVLMYVNDPLGQSSAAAIDRLMPELNMPFQIVDKITYDPKARDLAIEVAKAKSAQADLHIVMARLNDAVLMVREMVKQQYNPMAFMSPGGPGLYEAHFLKVLGKYADYAINCCPWYNPKQELSKTATAMFQKAYPDQVWDPNGFFSFEAVVVASDAFKRAGRTEPQALVEALKTTNIPDRILMGGPISFDEKGQLKNFESAVVQNLKGRTRVVLPAASSEDKLVFPVPAWSSRA